MSIEPAVPPARTLRAGRQRLQVTSPHTGKLLHEFQHADPAGLDRAVRAAQRAQRAWAALPAAKRASLLEHVGALLVENGEEVARMITAETGKPIAHAREEVFVHSTAAFERAGEAILRSPCRPLGVIGVATSSPFPAGIPAIALASVLASGNAVVWKPSRYAPGTAALMAELLARAGVGSGLVGVVTGLDDLTAAMVGHPGLQGTFVTGSGPSGEHVVVQAKFERRLLGLGGHGALVVRGDDDLDAAVESAVRGCYHAAGAVLSSVQRILVHGDVHDEFVAALRTRLSELRIGDPADPATELGPMPSHSARERVIDYVDDAWTRGAAVDQVGPTEGLFYPATVLTGVTDDMQVAHALTNGPLAPVTKVAGDDDALAIVGALDLTVDPANGAADRMAPYLGLGTAGGELVRWLLGRFSEPA